MKNCNKMVLSFVDEYDNGIELCKFFKIINKYTLVTGELVCYYRLMTFLNLSNSKGCFYSTTNLIYDTL